MAEKSPFCVKHQEELAPRELGGKRDNLGYNKQDNSISGIQKNTHQIATWQLPNQTRASSIIHRQYQRLSLCWNWLPLAPVIRYNGYSFQPPRTLLEEIFMAEGCLALSPLALGPAVGVVHQKRRNNSLPPYIAGTMDTKWLINQNIPSVYGPFAAHCPSSAERLRGQ